MAIRILHTGDLHIGNFPGPEENGENVRFKDICKCLDALVAGAKEQKPDIAVIAGDIFHQARVWSDRGLKEQQTAVHFLRELERICPVVVMRGTPNHDSEEQFKTLDSTFYGDDSVHIITEPDVGTYHSYDGKAVQIACLPGFDRGFYRAKHPGLSKEEENEVFTQSIADLIVGLKAQCDAGSPTVLVSHYTITGCNMESGQTAFFSQFEPVVYPDTLQAADFNLVCFGHIHRPQQLDGCKNTFYCGAISALNFNDEGQERGYWLHDVEDDGTVHSTFQQLPTRQYKTIRLKDEDVAEIINADRAEDKFPFPVPDVKGDIVRVLYDCTDEHKEKQLPVARQQKEAASLRVFELSGEIEELEKELEETRTELAEEQSKTVGTAELQAQVEAAEAEIKAMQDAAQAATLKLGGLKKQAEELAKKLKQAAELQNSVNVLGGKAAGYEELKKAFSQDGIPHNIIRSIIPVFEATATNILGQMSQGRMSVEFVTEKVLKSNSKKEVTTLDIIINDVDTGRLPYMSRSGGERVKAALSVILALSEIKSSKAGVQLGFLFIDEPPFLDAPGVQAYCDALEAIQNRYSNLKVMAITHDPAMKSRFPQSVDVVKTAEGSKVIYE